MPVHPTQRQPVAPETGLVPPGDTLQPAPNQSPSGTPETTPAPAGPAVPAPPPTVDGELVLQAGIRPVPEYELVSRLGAGGFGEVWKAIGPGGFPVALKFLRVDGRSGANELRALAVMKNIRHPHLLSMFGTWQVGNWLIVAMELGDRTLDHRLLEARQQNVAGIPLLELLEYMREAAKGIDHLNELGIQHRDIKPQNFLLVGGGLKVADFGLAKLLENSFASNSGSMTPGYAAPEFFKGQTSPHSDQYSLGITYCYLRGGRLPFSGNAMQIMFAHLQEDPDLLMIAENERPIILRALAKRPEERWPSCRAFVSALYRACGLHDSRLSLEHAAMAAQQPRPVTTASPQTLHESGLAAAQSTLIRPRSRVGRVVAVLLLLGTLGVGAASYWFRDPLRKMAMALATSKTEDEPMPKLADSHPPAAQPKLKAKNGATAKAEKGRKDVPENKKPAEERKNPIVPPKENTVKKPEPKPIGKPKPTPPLAPVASLEVFPPNEVVTLPAWDKTEVPVTIKQANLSGLIKLEFTGLPPGVEAGKLQIPAGLNNWAFELKARRGAPSDEVRVTMRAVAGDNTHRTQFRLKIAPAVLKPDIVNSLGMNLVLLKPRTFMQGSPANEPGRGRDEGPVRDVKFSRPFYLGAHEVTQEEFKKVMGRNPSCFQKGHDGEAQVGDQPTERLPVETVSWQEAVSFCETLSSRQQEKDAGRVYRLPTEAEWEYACRAGSSAPYAKGTELTTKDANFRRDRATGARTDGTPGRPIPVGSFGANAFGLYDMHGNVAEWCSDWYDAAAYASGPVDDPTGPKDGKTHVIRGGSWSRTVRHARSAARSSAIPQVGNHSTGFRVAMTYAP